MRGIKEIRVDNLNTLIDEAGGRKEFTDTQEATEQGIAYGFVGQLVNMSRGIGDSTATKLEIIGRKPKYWLDQSRNFVHEDQAEYNAVSPDRFEWINAYGNLNQAERENILTTIRLMLKSK